MEFEEEKQKANLMFTELSPRQKITSYKDILSDETG